MSNLLLDALAASSAHGISRAAATQSIPVRVVWILLFLFFLGLFCNSSVNLVDKLINVSIVTSRDEHNRVSFELPDLYFCPMNSFSGSYLFTLNASEADIVNKEIENLGKLYDEIMMSTLYFNHSRSLHMKARNIFRSMSYQTRKLLLQQPTQSLFNTKDITEMVLVEHNNMCFKPSLSKSLGQLFQSKGAEIRTIKYDLFTDPFNMHFSYDGEKISPIVHQGTKESLAPYLWDFQAGTRLDEITSIGYFIIIVEKDKMPSRFDNRLFLAPGRTYYISLSMEQVEYSKELYYEKCSPAEKNLEFVNLLNGKKIEYRPSYHGCLYDRYMNNLYKQTGYVTNTFPIPWSLREKPKLRNLTEIHKIDHSNISIWERWRNESYINLISGNESDICELLVPCSYRRYKAERLSFVSWPSFPGKNHATSLKNLIGDGHRPALGQLIKLGEQLDSGRKSKILSLREISNKNYDCK